MPAQNAIAKGKLSSPYTMHPGFAREAAIVARFKEKTGKTIEQWVELVRKTRLATAAARQAWLKEHGLTANYAMFVAQQAEGKGGAANYRPEELVNAMFAGQKEALRPLYETILAFGLNLGGDVRVCPCATIIPFYRKHVFAQVKAPNRSRIDLGFAFGGMKATGRLIDTGGFAKKDRITHRVEIASTADFDETVQAWFRRAYQMNAG